MKKLHLKLLSFVFLASFVLSTAMPLSIAIATPADQINNGVSSVGGGNSVSLGQNIANITNILLFLAGAIAVIMIVIGGIRYITSNGEQANLKSAKDTILYSVIGLIVTIIAYAIVNFTISSF